MHVPHTPINAAIEGIQFTTFPATQTVTYGQIVEFVCQIPTCNESLHILVNGTKVVPYRGINDDSSLSNCPSISQVKPLSELDSREYGGNYSCTQNNGTEMYTVRFWITANNRTLKVVNYVNCKINENITSEKAYITVEKSECTNQEFIQNDTRSCNCTQDSMLTIAENNRPKESTSSLMLMLLCLCTTINWLFVFGNG